MRENLDSAFVCNVDSYKPQSILLVDLENLRLSFETAYFNSIFTYTDFVYIVSLLEKRIGCIFNEIHIYATDAEDLVKARYYKEARLYGYVQSQKPSSIVEWLNLAQKLEAHDELKPVLSAARSYFTLFSLIELDAARTKEITSLREKNKMQELAKDLAARHAPELLNTLCNKRLKSNDNASQRGHHDEDRVLHDSARYNNGNDFSLCSFGGWNRAVYLNRYKHKVKNSFYTQRGADVSLAVDLIKMCFDPNVDRIVLCSSDSDFEALVTKCRSQSATSQNLQLTNEIWVVGFAGAMKSSFKNMLKAADEGVVLVDGAFYLCIDKAFPVIRKVLNINYGSDVVLSNFETEHGGF